MTSNNNPTPGELKDNLNHIQELLASTWRHDRELGRLQDELQRVVAEKVLDMRTQLGVIRDRLERIQANIVKSIGDD